MNENGRWVKTFKLVVAENEMVMDTVPHVRAITSLQNPNSQYTVMTETQQSTHMDLAIARYNMLKKHPHNMSRRPLKVSNT